MQGSIIPEEPLRDTVWEKHVITMEVLNDRADIHGGFFPGGVGDVDMDGDNDVVMVGRWYRNEGEGRSWSREFLPYMEGSVVQRLWRKAACRFSGKCCYSVILYLCIFRQWHEERGNGIVRRVGPTICGCK